MSKLKFKETIQLNIVTAYDEVNDKVTGQKTILFQKDQVVEVYILDDEESEYILLQFADGSYIPCIQKSLVEELPEDDINVSEDVAYFNPITGNDIQEDIDNERLFYGSP